RNGRGYGDLSLTQGRRGHVRWPVQPRLCVQMHPGNLAEGEILRFSWEKRAVVIVSVLGHRVQLLTAGTREVSREVVRVPPERPIQSECMTQFVRERVRVMLIVVDEDDLGRVGGPARVAA